MISPIDDLTIGEIFRANSSRTESKTIVPQLGQTDSVEARFLLQEVQIINLKRLNGFSAWGSGQLTKETKLGVILPKDILMSQQKK